MSFINLDHNTQNQVIISTLNANRADIKAGVLGTDSLSIATSLSPIEHRHDGVNYERNNVVAKLDFEIRCLQVTGKYSHDSGFLPSTEGKTPTQWLLELVALRRKVDGFAKPARTIEECDQPADKRFVEQFAGWRAPLLVSLHPTWASSIYKWLADGSESDYAKVLRFDAETPKQALADLKKAAEAKNPVAAHRLVTTAMHSVRLSPAEIEAHYATIKAASITQPVYMEVESQLFGIVGTQNLQVSLSRYLGIDTESKLGHLKETVFAQNKADFDALVQKELDDERKAAEAAARQSEIEQAMSLSEKLKKARDAVAAGTATKEELSLFMSNS